MPDQQTTSPARLCEVRYVTLEAAGGATCVYLSDLPQWLAARPGTLIVEIRELSIRRPAA